MTRIITILVLFGLTTMTAAAETIDRLPQPDYRPQPSDPLWLASVVQFHGHLGPAVVAGARMGMIGLRAVEAKGSPTGSSRWRSPSATRCWGKPPPPWTSAGNTNCSTFASSSVGGPSWGLPIWAVPWYCGSWAAVRTATIRSSGRLTSKGAGNETPSRISSTSPDCDC